MATCRSFVVTKSLKLLEREGIVEQEDIAHIALEVGELARLAHLTLPDEQRRPWHSRWQFDGS